MSLYIWLILPIYKAMLTILSIMSGQNITASLTRPKIHRLPASARPKAAAIALPLPLANNLFFILPAVVLLAFIIAGVAINKHKNPLLNANNEAPIAQITAASDGISLGKTIIIRDSLGGIVGQMAKIPAETEQITEIKTASDIDNRAGRELLSIISKY
jgi:hypothetical protein